MSSGFSTESMNVGIGEPMSPVPSRIATSLRSGPQRPSIPLGQDLPRRHGGARHPLAAHAEEVLVGGKLPGRGDPDLVLARGEVAGSREEALGPGTVALARDAVAERALLLVDL